MHAASKTVAFTGSREAFVRFFETKKKLKKLQISLRPSILFFKN
jgi:hypothetical protein